MFDVASDEDFVRFYKVGWLEGEWRGRVMRRGRLVVGLAGILVDEDGTYWGFFDLPIWERRGIVFRHALRFLEECKQDGITQIRTACEEEIPRAKEFLERLGFERTGRKIQNKDEWEWRASQQ